jgi:hypothetical protein
MRSNSGAGTSDTDTFPDCVAHPPALHASRRIVFGPDVEYLVWNVEVVPEAGDPPEAIQLRESTVPAIFAEQVTSAFSFATGGVHSTDEITGALTAGETVGPPPPALDVGVGALGVGSSSNSTVCFPVAHAFFSPTTRHTVRVTSFERPLKDVESAWPAPLVALPPGDSQDQVTPSPPVNAVHATTSLALTGLGAHVNAASGTGTPGSLTETNADFSRHLFPESHACRTIRSRSPEVAKAVWNFAASPAAGLPPSAAHA